MPMYKFVLTLLFTLFSSIANRPLAQEVVLYGAFEPSYQAELLQHALSYAIDKNYQVTHFTKIYIPKPRALDFMSQGKEIDVIYGGSTKERESKAKPIRIPVLKGLNGWRIPLVHHDSINLFSKINNFEAFQQLTPGQFHSWSDTKVIESNGIHVEKGSDYEGLFLMLDKQRFDYFPRSILEIFHEYNERKHLNITIEKTSIIHYPTAYYFYVGKNNKTLANDIQLGLEQAIKDGSFSTIFNKHFGKLIETFNPKNRKIFSLKNPFLPKETPLNRKELWVNFDQFEQPVIRAN